MSNILTNQTKQFSPDEQEVYLTLKRDLSWREGFGILFVRCTPAQESLIIEKIKQDIKNKKIDVLKLEHSIDNLYDLIEKKIQDNPIDILFISGIEKSLALEDYIKRTLEQSKTSYQTDYVSPLLGHLNWQRERFRDNFNCCLVFTVRTYTLKDLVRRAPDFFDWKSGVIKFPVDDELRINNYLALIQELLSCNSGEEVHILNANQELLDEGFINTIVQVAEKLTEEGEESPANWLINLARQLRDLLSTEKYKQSNTNEDYLNFLMETLQKIAENHSPESVYSFWQRNLDKLDDNLGRLLQAWATETLEKSKPKQANYIAAIIGNFSNLIQQFPLGSRASNLEVAIIGYQVIAQVYTFTEFPQQWAAIQNDLAAAYSDRIRGDRADNLEQAISCYKNALQIRTRQAFPVDWAMTQNNIANAYKDSIRGDRAGNLEQAISCYKNALQIYTRKAFPGDWAQTQNNLANAYSDRIRGDRADNLEQAIAGYENALKIRTHEAFPVDWAQTKNNLGEAYRNRIRGDRAENLEQAIACYKNALQILTREAFPVEWAATQNNLAAAYSDRIRGNRADNLERAIIYLQNTLQIYTREAFPVAWAMTQNNLGEAYRNRIRGERANNLEQAIIYLQNALQIYTRKAFPADWAMTQNNLAAAYSNRIRRERANNLEQAIIYLQNALQIYTREAFPADWARTQNNLGEAYRNRIRGERADNLEQAIIYLQNALQIYNREAFPVAWAATQNNLALAYSDRIKGERADNLEQAIACCKNALQIRTREAFPVDWAITQNNLALVYSNRIRGKRADNLERAIEAYKQALQVCTPEALPLDCLRTGRNLGNAALQAEKWQVAIKGYHLAIEAVETSRSWATTPQRKREVMEAAIDVYRNIVQACIDNNQLDLAIEYVERSKTRNLVESITKINLYPQGNVAPTILNQLDSLRQEIHTEQLRLDNEETLLKAKTLAAENNQPQAIPDRTHLNQLQQQLDQLIEEQITPIDPSFSLTQKVESIPFSNIQSLIDKHTAIIEWYITNDKIITFIITQHNPQPILWESTAEDREALYEAMNVYLTLYYNQDGKTEWRNQLPSLLQNFATILHLDEILAHIPEQCDKLILIPHIFLHLLPIHALPINSQQVSVSNNQSQTQTCLLHRFSGGVRYTPSCQLLKLAQNRNRPHFQNLLAIQNPTDDLIYTDLEVEIIRSFFSNAQVLVKQEATKTNLNQQNLPSFNCSHFSCHGYFNLASPLESALILANKERLTLAEIFQMSLSQCRFVTLSACETGFTDFQSISDEYIGLPSGFLFAGSPTVVSSLWTVSDLSTAFLMIKFYQNLRQFPQLQEGDMAIALKQAQIWLQNLTCQEFEQELAKYHQVIKKLKQILSPAEFFELEDAIEVERKRIKQLNSNHKPFANPFYWAAFAAIGV